MSSEINWKKDVLPLVKRFLVWYIGKPSRTFITIGVGFWLPGTLDLMAMLIQGLQALMGHAAGPVVEDDFGPSRMLGTAFIVLGVAMTIFEWSQSHWTKANRIRVRKANGQIQRQLNLFEEHANLTKEVLQVKFQEAWGPVYADPDQIGALLRTDMSNRFKAVDCYVRSMCLVKLEGDWFLLRSKWIRAAFWTYLLLTFLSIVVVAVCLIIVTAASAFPELLPVPAMTKWTVAVLMALVGYAVYAFKDLMLESASAIQLVDMKTAQKV